MPPTAHEGVKYANVAPSQIKSVRHATPGFPFVNVGPAYESLTPGYHFDASLNFTSAGRELTNGTTVFDMVTAKATVDVAQTTIPELKNYYTLCRDPHQLQIGAVTRGGLTYYNFVEEAGTVTVPTGSQLVGTEWEFLHNDERRSLTLTSTVDLTEEEYAWMLDNVTAAIGGTSGSTLALTETSKTRANVKRPRFQKVTINGVNMGVLEQGAGSVSIKTMSEANDLRGRPINTWLVSAAEFVMRQTAVNDQLAALTDRQQVYTIIVSDLAGYTYKWTTVTPPNFEVMMDSKKSYIKLVWGMRSPIVTGTDSIDFGVGTATQIEFKEFGYA